MKLGSLISQYPALSHTFVLREVRALAALAGMVEPQASAYRKQGRIQRNASAQARARPDTQRVHHSGKCCAALCLGEIVSGSQ